MPKQNYEFFDLQQNGDLAILDVAVNQLRHPAEAQQFNAEVRSALQTIGVKNALIDMRQVQYVGSTAFATLLVLAKALKDQGGLLKLCDLHPDVQVGANILGLSKAVEIHPDRQSAIDSFKSE
jgi:anti-sigma B factor antagonist